MAIFTVPANVFVSGHVNIEADTREAALEKAKELNEAGIYTEDLQDPEWSSELMLDELEKQFPEEDEDNSC